MTISVLLLVAPDFIRCAVLLVAIALGLQQLLSSHTSRSQRPPFWRALGIAGWSFALNTEPALAKAKDLLWDSELVERIGWIFFDVGVVYLWFPNVVLAVFPSIGIRRSHLFVVFLLNLLLRVSVRILSLVSAGVVETSAATSGAACVLIALQIALLSTSSAFFRCSQRSRVSFTSCAVPWVTVCATLAMELASVSLRIDYKAPTVAQATMRLLGTLFAVLSISTLLVLFYAKAYSSQGKNNSEKGPLHPTKRDSTGSGAHFDAEFLERLVSLSFSSRNSTQQEDLAEATKFSRDSGFGDGRTGEMGVIQDGSRLVSAGGLPRNTITFPVALPAGSENKLASSPDSRRSNFLRMVTDRPPTPADTLGLLSRD
ncbi:hypothetical protein BKA62DRAFT_667241 [Auriculariales sp. MPI-PUGE-AT-0066]|nr:hypothetical protein BKA62DRAFT_667241 [Auriculariales sp. MPI-PUGE-AT-0066]